MPPQRRPEGVPMTPMTAPTEALTIRMAVPADADALGRLAQLDSAPPLVPAPLLVAEVDGELRAALPHGATELALPAGTFVDVDALTRGTPQQAVAIPGLGRELLEGMEFGTSPAFDTWLLMERRRLVGAAEAALHDASLDRLAAGEAAAAVGLAARLVELNPYDENYQELLVRSYAETGDREAANRQGFACLELFRAELGREPG